MESERVCSRCGTINRADAKYCETCAAPLDAATESGAAHLRKEGVDPARIFVTGNTGIDAVLHVRDALAAGRLVSGSLPKRPTKITLFTDIEFLHLRKEDNTRVETVQIPRKKEADIPLRSLCPLC